MLQNILKYWYELEFFNPCWPVKPGEDTNLIKEELPWLQPQSDPKVRVSYDLYFGRAETNNLIVWLLDKLSLSKKGEAIENDNSLTCLFALKIDENGRYVSKSFAVSSFVWAVCRLAATGSIDGELNGFELECLQERIESAILDLQDGQVTPLLLPDLEKIYFLVCDKLEIDCKLLKDTLWSRKKVEYADKNGQFPPLETATELMQSFYLNDLERIQEAPTSNVARYVQAMLSTENTIQRIQIDSNITQMKYWLRAEAFPMGAWPSRYSPSLMQQLGINLAVNGGQRVFSVNGPPGTGKTTLLKEIVVANIVNRAKVMAGYNSPEQAFQRAEFQNPPDQYQKYFYQVDHKLSAYGMIVASNNNAAVENISVELPKAIQKERTGRFSAAAESGADTYFADVAEKLIGEPAWGLISAKLGRKSNRGALKERLWWAKDNVTLKRYFEGETPDWNTARQRFEAALQAVIQAQEDIKKAQEFLEQMQESEKHLFETKSKRDATYAEFVCQQNILLSQEEGVRRLEERLQTLKLNAQVLHSSIPFWKRVVWGCFRDDALIKEWRGVEQEIQDTVIALTRQRTACQLQRESVAAVQKDVQLEEAALQEAEIRQNNIQVEAERYRKQFGSNWADSSYWQDICKNELSQAACPWTYPEYDKMREELFYQALMLHKAFLLSSNEVKQNLVRLFALWDDKFSKIDRKAAYGHLLNTLLLVIPVVSTTFASVQSFMEDIQSEELGMLVIDEAGQAVPSSALGALWRTRTAIVVGDPLQVEPIATIPGELRKRFADENNIPPVYRIPELSVQMLADQMNPYGGVRDLKGEKIWLGCPLTVHRRCINPMFQISNEIAYNGRMFSKTAAPDSGKVFLMEKSIWFDCKGAENGNKDHAVPQQIKLTANLFECAIDSCGGSLPNLYLISPFTSVVRALKKEIRLIIERKLPEMDAKEITGWLDENCGTVHTFQGKEAEEVLFVLGCDSQGGKSAAQWVGQKPNIINVAVSRAKYRLGVVGDYTLWKDIPYVQILCKYLERE